MDIILNPELKKQLDKFVEKPNHALLISGPLGAGKYTLCNYISTKILNIDASKLATYPYFLRRNEAKNTVSIDMIRELTNFTNLKTPGKKPIRRIVVIEEAQKMTTEAQNAFLKLLEEPPADTLFLLTTSDTNGLLPTVLSRVQRLTNKPPARERLAEHFINLGFGKSEVDKALNLANNQPGLASALLDSDSKHELTKQITEAKKLLSSPIFERLSEVNNLAKNKQELPNLILALRRICRAKMTQAADKNDYEELKKWHTKLNKVRQAEKLLSANPQPKLLLTDLLLNI